MMDSILDGILARKKRFVRKTLSNYNNSAPSPRNPRTTTLTMNSCCVIISIFLLSLVAIGTSISKLSDGFSQVSIPRIIGSNVRANPSGDTRIIKASKPGTFEDLKSYATLTKNAEVIFVDSSACAEADRSVDANRCIRYYPYIDLRDYLEHEEALLQWQQRPEPNVIPKLLREKPIQEHRAILTRCGYKGGDVRSQINQDRAIIISPFLVQGVGGIRATDGTQSSLNFIMGIFDGHGQQGHDVAHHTVQLLPKELAKQLELAESQNDSNIQNALVQTFIKVDETIPQNISSSGCTASVILRLESKIYVANAGDSQSYIGSYHRQTNTVRIVYITRQDKPDLEDERKRIETAGGRVFIPAKSDPSQKLLPSSRVLIPESSFSEIALAMSRSIGDHDGKALGVIAEPIVDILDVHGLKAAAAAHFVTSSGVDDDVELFAVSASDGLFDFIAPLEVAKILAKSLYRDRNGGAPSVMEVCEQLIRESSKIWHEEARGYRDDITLVVSKIEI